MSGIRSTSGVPPTLSGSASTSANGPEQVAPVTPAKATGEQTGLPSSNSTPPTPKETPEVVRIQAVVTAKTTGENVILHTDAGNFRLTTQSPLAVGSQILFEIDAVEDVIFARLLSMDGKAFTPPISAKLLPVLNKIASGTEGYIRAGQLHPLEMQSGFQNLSAILGTAAEKIKQALPVGPPPPPDLIKSAGSQPGTPPQNIAGTSNPAGLFNAQPPTPVGTNPATNAQLVAAALYSSYKALAEGPIGPPVKTSAPLDARAHLLARQHIVEAEILRPAATLTEPGSAAFKNLIRGDKIDLVIRQQDRPVNAMPQANILQGKVIALTGPSGSEGKWQMHVASPAGMFTYAASKPQPAGATVQFAVADKVTAFPLPYGDIQQPGPRPPLVGLMGDWQNLRQAMNVVANHEPMLAQAVLNSVIPQANAQLSSQLLFFLAALQLGTVEKWLGQDFRAALKDAGRTSLLQSLDDDFKSLGRLQAEQGGQDWKSLNFPFFDGNNLRQIRMFYRRNQNPDDPDGPDDGTRFVIELNLSRSGPVQLDGQFHKLRFDLTLRSETELPGPMKSQIIKLFSDNMEISGLTGQLVFQVAPPLTVDPLSEWEAATPAAPDEPISPTPSAPLSSVSRK